MHPPNHRPTETALGPSDERRGPLPQEARNRRLARLGQVGITTLVAVVLVLVLAAVVVGTGKAIDWFGNYLIPVLIVLGVIVGVFGLAAWEIAKLHDKHKQPW